MPYSGPPLAPECCPASNSDFLAYALVKTPDYTYWNPVPETRATSEAACRALAEDYARRTFVAPHYPEWRAERFLRELEIRPAPGSASPCRAR